MQKHRETGGALDQRADTSSDVTSGENLLSRGQNVLLPEPPRNPAWLTGLSRSYCYSRCSIAHSRFAQTTCTPRALWSYAARQPGRRSAPRRRSDGHPHSASHHVRRCGQPRRILRDLRSSLMTTSPAQPGHAAAADTAGELSPKSRRRWGGLALARAEAVVRRSRWFCVDQCGHGPRPLRRRSSWADQA